MVRVYARPAGRASLLQSVSENESRSVRCPDGTLRLFLISDDNDCAKGGHRHGTSGQRTLLLSFSLTD